MRSTVQRAGTRILATALLVALAVAISSCTDQTAEANGLIAQANGRMAAYAEAGRQLESLLGEAERLPMTSAEASKGIDLTRRMTERLDEQSTAVREARGWLRQVDSLNVSDELKTYLRQEQGATASMLEQDTAARAIVDDLRKLYELVGSGKATQAQVKEVSKRIEQRTEALAALEEQTGRLEKAAQAYYDSRRLGGK